MDGVPLNCIDGADVSSEGSGLLLKISFRFTVAGNDHTKLSTNHEFGRLEVRVDMWGGRREKWERERERIITDIKAER